MAEKTVLITGAAGGIGQAVVKRFAGDKNFKRIVLIDHPSKRERMVYGSVAAKTSAMSCEYSFRYLDLADPSVHQLMAQLAASCKKIDVLVNTAGVAQEFGALIKTDLEKARKVMEINFWGTLQMCYAVLPYMRSAGYGRIVNISSIAARHGDAGNLIYAASKAAIESLTKTLAREATFNKDGAPFDITVNAVAPGIIDTDMAKLLSDKVKEAYSRGNPCGRLGSPEEVAKVIYWLATGAPQYLTGEIIRVDGGFLA
ncbi:hypothetical protein A2926_00825 [Candidatus Giovannonibacteria bacterium RIFCSPLOWO2_01_FULL_44_40]|uniref:Short-chain dehydrogenase n=1 Tax=Candidatus Giovannonibacteria bacterium RIFCSPHIGHO2_01_FULL_45_23 TaxID=1798325 RepID=A0A1F5VJ12_9BACT|nr:MAG: hypothetical protein A2834_01225 [Candidatus Giovannonibacteria bacterium RIFCSPHIGHO2_01_FULL_45_23]OGF75636.1 MAG: hypothetical protein A3C77_03325 [Candidatus Giovannonibacteria bacterium RIFCSPHIGHO2_02_FULL_45_13]OGF80060.1 MAG: hypothetical protein A2926_00825 [Candidatus Giovannonibacteria bacterium RIFCSPLOWO2_01_FULL_44_40]